MVVEAEEEEGEVMGEDAVGTEEAVEDTTRGDMGMVVEVGGRKLSCKSCWYCICV